MTAIGAIRAPQPIPNPNLLNPAIGQRQSSPTFFLRATPRIFTVLNVGGSNTNQDFAFRALQLPGLPPLRGQLPRFTSGAGNQNPENPGGVGNIASLEAFGEPRLILLRAVLLLQGITTNEALGTPHVDPQGVIPPPSSEGSPSSVEMNAEELASCWANLTNDVYSASVDSSGPLYGAAVSVS